MAIVDAGGSGTSSSPREDRRAPKGAVYRISADGVWDQLWESRDDSPYDLTFDRSGALIIGTGGKGKLYRLEGDPLRPTLLARAAAQQVTAFYKDPSGRLYYATANPGKLFRLSTDRATRGTYESDVRDAQMISTWGTMSWRGTAANGNKIELFTRAGNTETPDDTWSAWSAAYTNPAGSPITSPKARYLQWRAVMTGKGDGPVLTSVTAAYLQRNLRPVVRSITVHPPGIVFQKPFSTGDPELAGFDDQSTPERKLAAAASATPGNASALGRRTYQKGLQTLAWKADDENDDDLVYDVLYRREGETAWKTLRKATSDTILVWDTTTVPNGTYFVRIVASDAPSNPLGTALAGELDSVEFEVDNTAPTIVGEQRSRRSRTHHHHVRRQGRPLTRAAGRVLAGRAAMARRLPGGWDRGLARGALRAGRGRRARGSRLDAARQRFDEQRGDDPRRRARSPLTHKRGSPSSVVSGFRRTSPSPAEAGH